MVYDFSKFNINMIQFVNENHIESKTDFLIVTNLNNKYTYTFRRGYNEWILEHKWKCSIGTKKDPTITGDFEVLEKIPSFGQKKGFMAKWGTQFQGNYMYHSIIYNAKGTMVVDGRLGYAISHGCIRLATVNAKWIYDTIPKNTKVMIY